MMVLHLLLLELHYNLFHALSAFIPRLESLFHQFRKHGIVRLWMAQKRVVILLSPETTEVQIYKLEGGLV